MKGMKHAAYVAAMLAAYCGTASAVSFVVTDTAGNSVAANGKCSLQEALTVATTNAVIAGNTDCGAGVPGASNATDTITFNVPVVAPATSPTITLSASLNPIVQSASLTDALVIDGGNNVTITGATFNAFTIAGAAVPSVTTVKDLTLDTLANGVIVTNTAATSVITLSGLKIDRTTAIGVSKVGAAPVTATNLTFTRNVLGLSHTATGPTTLNTSKFGVDGDATRANTVNATFTSTGLVTINDSEFFGVSAEPGFTKTAGTGTVTVNNSASPTRVTFKNTQVLINAGTVNFDNSVNLNGSRVAITPTAAVTANIRKSTITGSAAAASPVQVNAGAFTTLLTIEDTTISGNSVSAVGGAGVRFVSADATAASRLIINRSTLTGNVNNTAGNGGGVLCDTTADVQVQITNSTIHGNTAFASGGGVHVAGGCDATIRASTITGNTAAAGAGGVFSAAATALINLSHTVVAENTFAAAPDCGNAAAQLVMDAAVPNRNNFIGSNTGCAGATNTSGTNVIGGVAPNAGTNPLTPGLGALAANGGITQTRMPASTSPVVNAGGTNAAGCVDASSAAGAALTQDQRGSGRPVATQCDIGSVETGGASAGTVQANTSGTPTPTTATKGSSNFPMLRFTISNNSGSPLSITGVTLTAGGDGNDQLSVTNVSLFRTGNATALASGTFPADNGVLQLNFAAINIAAGSSIEFEVQYNFAAVLVQNHTGETLMLASGTLLGSLMLFGLAGGSLRRRALIGVLALSVAAGMMTGCSEDDESSSTSTGTAGTGGGVGTGGTGGTPAPAALPRTFNTTLTAVGGANLASPLTGSTVTVNP